MYCPKPNGGIDMLDSKKIVEGVIGKKQYNPFSNFTKDTDGDRVPDIIDCQPYNPKKQGWIHDMAEKAKDKYAQYKKQRDEDKIQEAELRRQAKEEGKTAYMEERKKFLTKQEVDKAKARAKAPSGFAGFVQGISNNMAQGRKVTGASRPKTSYKKTTQYVKQKSGGYKKVTAYRKVTSAPRTAAPARVGFTNAILGTPQMSKGGMKKKSNPLSDLSRMV